MTNILAVDQGTSGTKAVVVNDRGEVLALTEIAITPRYGADGLVEQDPQQMLDSVIDSGRRAVAAADVEIHAFSLANQGETVLAWDPETGEPLSDMIVWQDRRAASVCDRLRPHADRLARATGLVLDPYFTAPKMTWLRENVTRDGVVTTSDAWLIHRLTGEFVTDITTASRSLLVPLGTADWDPELLALFGLADETLPRIVPSDRVIGVTRAFGGEIPVGGLVVDQQAALIAENCLTPGTAKCTFGTGAFMLVNVGGEVPAGHGELAASVAWQLGDDLTYCLDGQIYTAASAVRWLEQLDMIAHASDLDQISAASSEGVFCVPAFAGLAAPRWEPTARAALLGMSLATQTAHIVRAVLEGLAAQIHELAQSITAESGMRLERLRVDGGLTRSRVLMQSVADLLGIPVEIYPSEHATPLGAAALARLAIGDAPSLAEAVFAWRSEREFTPEWSRAEAETFMRRWRRAADAVVDFAGANAAAADAPAAE